MTLRDAKRCPRLLALLTTTALLLGIGAAGAQGAQAATRRTSVAKVTRTVLLHVTPGKAYKVQVKVMKPRRATASKTAKRTVRVTVGSAATTGGAATRSRALSTTRSTTVATTVATIPASTTTTTLPVTVTVPQGTTPASVVATPLPGPTATTPVVSQVLNFTAPSPVASTPAAPAGPTSVTWRSGVTPPAISAAAAQSFADYRGRANAVVSAFPERGSWSDISSHTWVVDQYRGFTGTLVLGVPLLPDTNGGTLADVAAGAHDADFASFARNLVARGRGNAVLRLGWEFNGDWMAWSAKDPAAFKAAFRRIAGVLKGVSPAFSINWNGNIGPSACGHDAFTELYPGDDVVDGIGVDVYDLKYWAVRTAADFTQVRTMAGGLDQWVAFARTHSKPFSVPEWGLSDAAGEGQPGDQPAFIQGMRDLFAAVGSGMDFEAYYSDPNDYQRSDLLSTTQNPRSRELYRALWAS